MTTNKGLQSLKTSSIGKLNNCCSIEAIDSNDAEGYARLHVPMGFFYRDFDVLLDALLIQKVNFAAGVLSGGGGGGIPITCHIHVHVCRPQLKQY